MAPDLKMEMRIFTRTMTAADVADVVRLHRLVLGYTLNAQLGEGHLRRLYRGLLISRAGIVTCAYDAAHNNCIIGFVSGTDDAGQLQADLIRAPGTRILLSLVRGILSHPWLARSLYDQVHVNRPVTYRNQIITASLLTLGVQPDYSRRGIGGQLVRALMSELQGRGVKRFHLNTRNTNEFARHFYMDLGGQLVRSWQGNDIYVFLL